MSFRKREKAVQKIHKERGQPLDRKRFGHLERHKDYIVRARHYHKKQAQLKQLYEKARNRNPDEFYFKMIKAKTIDGQHIIPNDDELTSDQLKLLKTQDLKYIRLKMSIERKKIEKLQASFSLSEPKSTRTLFVEEDEPVQYTNHESPINWKSDTNKELDQRLGRLQSLTVVAQKMEKKLQKTNRNQPGKFTRKK